MQETDTSREPLSDQGVRPKRRSFFAWRSILVTLVLVAIVLMAVLPPLLNVNRFKRRIVTSISASLGRPVHLDNVSLVLLPFPGFRLENFVVAEDPSFGSEPVIHANSVMATLRVSSLWRRKVEFSRISLQEPSINLVHDANGRWNVEGILLQAAQIPAAPTAQASPSANPRFPYVEATGARVNIKSGLEKLPFSFTEADFDLWLPSSGRWRVRLVAKPTRTDTNASDTGTVSLEASLGQAERFDQIPLELSVEWKNAPLGEASRILTGRDAGLRGDLRVNIAAAGTIGSSLIKSTLDLRNARRAAFVPDRLLNLHAECQAISADNFHAFHQLHCAWPPATSNGGAPTLLNLTGDVPDVHKPASTSFEIGTQGLPAATLLDWLRIASPRVAADLTVAGSLSGSFSNIKSSSPIGNFAVKAVSLAGGPLGTTPVKLGDFSIASTTPLSPEVHASRRRLPATQLSAGTLIMSPTTIALGAKEPAILEARFDPTGYTLHLTGNVLPSRLLALAAAIPQFGDGLAVVFPQQASEPEPGTTKNPHPELAVHVDLTSNRVWLGAQTWSKATPPVLTRPPRRRP